MLSDFSGTEQLVSSSLFLSAKSALLCNREYYYLWTRLVNQSQSTLHRGKVTAALGHHVFGAGGSSRNEHNYRYFSSSSHQGRIWAGSKVCSRIIHTHSLVWFTYYSFVDFGDDLTVVLRYLFQTT